MADESKTMRVNRLHGPHHRSIATNLNIIGPTGDGLIHLHFFYDGFEVHADVGDVVASDAHGTQLKNVGVREGNKEVVRVEVAVVSMPVDRLRDVARAFGAQVEELSKVGAIPGKAGASN